MNINNLIDVAWLSCRDACDEGIKRFMQVPGSDNGLTLRQVMSSSVLMSDIAWLYMIIAHSGVHSSMLHDIRKDMIVYLTGHEDYSNNYSNTISAINLHNLPGDIVTRNKPTYELCSLLSAWYECQMHSRETKSANPWFDEVREVRNSLHFIRLILVKVNEVSNYADMSKFLMIADKINEIDLSKVRQL